GMLQEVYDSFVETGNRLYIETGQAHLVRATFEAAEENRACSLAVGLGQRQDFRCKMPPAYWDQLKQLQSAEAAALVHGGERPRLAMRRLRRSLIELEINAGASGAAFSPAAGLLDAVQRKLDSGSVLLSFDLAQPDSWLWAVDRSGMSLYQLP